MKDKLLTVSLFIVGALVIAGIFFAVFTNLFTTTQDGIVTKLKQVENY